MGAPVRIGARRVKARRGGKTGRGVFPNSTPEKPVVDVSRFELVLNGQAVRNLHSINGGEYGGESLIVCDKAKDAVVRFKE